MEFAKHDSHYPVAKRSETKDQIGDLSQWARCGCGKSMMYAGRNNPGIYLGAGRGRSMCNECYVKDRKRINSVSRERMGKERWIYPTSDGDDLEIAPPVWIWA